MIDTLPIGFSIYSRFIAPWIEEALKAAAIILLFRLNRIGYKLDAIISGFAIGAGFSVVENIFYLTIFPDYATGTWLVRGFGTAIMHGTTLALLAAIAHEFAEKESHEAAADSISVLRGLSRDTVSPWPCTPRSINSRNAH